MDYGPLFTLVIFYFLLSCYSAGMAQASGIMVPSLLIGGTSDVPYAGCDRFTRIPRIAAA
jgi:hypothetical protein